MTGGYTRTLRDYQEEMGWIRELGWSSDDLDSVPVHEQSTAGEEFLNLTNFGETSIGGFATEEQSPTSAGARNVRNLYVYRRETPEHLYSQLEDLVRRGGPSAFETGLPGQRGEAKDFPPRS